MSSTIHTAKHISGNQATTLFSLNGLNNYAPAQTSTLGIHGYPLQPQVAFKQYVTNIASFLYATVKNKVVRINDLPLGTIFDAPGTPLDPPIVRFVASVKNLSSDQNTKIVNALGPSASIETSGQTKIFQAPALPFAKLPSIIKIATDHFNPGREYVNPAGLFAFTIINTIIHAFLRTHSYPAFSDESDESLFEMNLLLAGHTVYEARMSGTGKTAKEVFDPKDYSARLLDTDDDVDEDMDEENALELASLREATGRIQGTGRDAVNKAKPCTQPQANIGPRNAVPHSPGLLFPYFDGLVQPDAVYLHSTILQHFRPLLGSTNTEIQDNFLMLRKGCGSLSTTSQGMVLTHLLLGVTLAMETQSRCFMLVEAGKYCGFVLLGARFAIFDSVKWCVSGSAEELSSALSRLDPHTTAIAEIIRLVSELTPEQYTGPDLTSASFLEPDLLIPFFSGVVVKNIEAGVIRDIDNNLRRLDFSGDGFVGRDPANMAIALQTLASAAPLKITRPTYFPTITTNIGSRAFKVLSRFGPESVSFWDEKGTEIRLEGKQMPDTVEKTKRKRGEVDPYGNLPKHLISTSKPLASAVKDMEKCMSKGMIKCNLGERARNHRGTVVSNERDRKLIWDALVAVAAVKGPAKKARSEEDPLKEGEIDIDALLLNL